MYFLVNGRPWTVACSVRLEKTGNAGLVVLSAVSVDSTGACHKSVEHLQHSHLVSAVSMEWQPVKIIEK